MVLASQGCSEGTEEKTVEGASTEPDSREVLLSWYVHLTLQTKQRPQTCRVRVKKGQEWKVLKPPLVQAGRLAAADNENNR